MRKNILVKLYCILAGLFVYHSSTFGQCSGTISDANFADAIRTLYPSLIGSSGDNSLTPAAATYSGELDFRGWGNPTVTSGAGSPYATKPRLASIEGIQCFTSLTKLNVSNQLLNSIPEIPATLRELRCSNNFISSLPALPSGLKVLNCFSNQLTSLPDLPEGFQAIACGLNRLTALPTLPASMDYLRCERQYTDAPTGTFSEDKKTLATLPVLPDALRALFCTDNKLTTLPELPASLAYLHVSGNVGLFCLPELPAAFFSAGLPSGPYYGFSQVGGVGFIAEPRLNVSSTPIKCLANAPSGIVSNKVNPGSFGNPNAVCSVAPSVSISTFGCSLAGNNAARVIISATSNTALEYSNNGNTYQNSNMFTQVPEGEQTFWVRRKDANAAGCPSAVAMQTVMVATAPAGFTAYTISNANFADAIRTLYPGLIGPAGDNRLTQAITCYDGELDFSGWGNPVNSSGETSGYASKPKLTSIAGIEYFSEIVGLNATGQNLSRVDSFPAGIKTVKVAKNKLTTLAGLPAGLDWLDMSSNAFTALPALPSNLKHVNCDNNRLTTLAGLPAGLKYLTCRQQHTEAPFLPKVITEDTKTLAALPALPSGLRALNCSDNKLTVIPTLPDSMVYLRVTNNRDLTCLPPLPPNFFTASLTSGTLAPYGLTDARLNVLSTGIVCLAGLPSGANGTRVSPSQFGGAIGSCAATPSITSTVSCAADGNANGKVRLLALLDNVSFGLEYSKDGVTFQESNLFTGLAPGTYTFYARRKITNPACQPIASGSISVTIAACNPATYVVSPTGNDQTGDGSEINPWKTIRYAVAKVKIDNGDTIRLAPGTFTESGIITLPSGVSLVGAGKDKSFIRVDFFYDMLAFPLSCGSREIKDASFYFAPENFVMQINGSNQVLKGFYLDGQDKRCHGGIYAKFADQVIWEELEIRNFRMAGLWTAKSYDSEIRYCKIVNSTWGNSRSAFGNILLYDCLNLRIHHNDIDVNDIGAYGIKTVHNFDPNNCPIGYSNPRDTYIAKTPVNVKIYENRITVPDFGTWNNFQAPAITIEFAGATPQQCEIYNNYLNNHVSVPGLTTAGDLYQYGGKTVHIHHNFFDMGKDDGSAYRYAIEATVPNMEIGYNYFIGGVYPIAMFNSGLDNDPRYTNHLVHHNVFFGARGTRNGYMPQVLLNYRVLPANFKFYNNTVVDNNGFTKILRFVPTATPRKGAEIINNIFVSPDRNAGKRFDDSLFVDPVFKRNLFYNMDAFGTDSIVVDSAFGAQVILALSSEKPKPYFELVDGSPAVNQGVVIPGITDGYQSTAPDLGAYESPFHSTRLRVLHQDGDRGQKTNNQVKPFLQFINDGQSTVPLGQITMRYWLTAENYAFIHTWVDYAQLGNSNIRMKYVPLEQPRSGAFGYVEYAFLSSAESLLPAGSSGPVHSRIAKSDWSNFNEADDYSFAANTSYTANSKITVYRNGQLIWGNEPATVPAVTRLKVQSENKNTTTNSNTIRTYLKVINEGNTPVSYKDLQVRYWFTAEGNSPLNYWIDYTQLGKEKVKGSFTKPTPSLLGADTYFELTIDSSAGSLYPSGSTGNIQYRLAKNNWSSFNETDDHSYRAAAPFADNERITVYYRGQLIYGMEPGATATARQWFGESESEETALSAYPNPTQSQVVISSSSSSEPIEVTFYSVGGQAVWYEKTRFNVPIMVSRLKPGMYLLRIQTPLQVQYLKLLKQ